MWTSKNFFPTFLDDGEAKVQPKVWVPPDIEWIPLLLQVQIDGSQAKSPRFVFPSPRDEIDGIKFCLHPGKPLQPHNQMQQNILQNIWDHNGTSIPPPAVANFKQFDDKIKHFRDQIVSIVEISRQDSPRYHQIPIISWVLYIVARFWEKFVESTSGWYTLRNEMTPTG